MGAVFGRLPGLPHHEANAIVVGEVFGQLDAQAALPGVTATIDSWRPDVVVREPCEFGSWAAAERAGVPQIVVWIGLAGMATRFDPILPRTARRPALAGRPPDRRSRRVRRRRHVLARARRIRRHRLGRRRGDLPLPRREPDARRRAAARPVGRLRTRRSSTSRSGRSPRPSGRSARVYPAVVEALADYPARILLTTGRGPRPGVARSAAAQRARRTVVAAGRRHAGGRGRRRPRWVRHHDGGAGGRRAPGRRCRCSPPTSSTTPSRIDAIGAGVCVEGGPGGRGADPAGARRSAPRTPLRVAARTIAAEIAALPDAAAAVPLIEDLAQR